MRTMHWNGERWYEDQRSVWLRVRQWVIWVGGWESGRQECRHTWRIWLRTYPGRPLRMPSTPVSLFGHRITFFGWGGQLVIGRRYLTWARRAPGQGSRLSRIYVSPNATPRCATTWIRGWRQSDLEDYREEQE